MDLTELIPRDIHAGLHWLGKLPPWIHYTQQINQEPTWTGGAESYKTGVGVDWDVLRDGPDHPDKERMTRTLEKYHTPGKMLLVGYMEAAGRLVADGPKIFHPNSEQFESLAQVEIRLQTTEFRSPYPAMVVGVPAACRKRLAATYGQTEANVPTMVLVRRWEGAGGNGCVLVVTHLRESRVNEYFLFHQRAGARTIEEVITTTVNYQQGEERVVRLGDLPESQRREKLMVTEVGRSALNCCLMLTHYGHRLAGPVDPVAYEKHRRKKHLRHLMYGDFLAVKMTQEIVVRQPPPPAHNPPGPGTGIEVRPHWVKGHWCAYPGQGAKRAAGETVPLYFKRPHLRRPDRIDGDVSESVVTYHG